MPRFVLPISTMFDRRLWQEARTHLPPILLTVLLHAALGIITIAQAFLLSRIVASVFLEGLVRAQLLSPLYGLLVLAILRSLVATGAELSAGRVALEIKTSLRTRLFSHLLRLGPIRASSERSGELSAALVNGVDALEQYFSRYLPQLAIAVIVPLTVLVAVFPVDILTGVILLVTAPLIPVFMVLIGRFGAALTGRQWRVLSLMSAHFLDVLQGLTALKQLGRGQAQVENVARISDRYRRTTMAVLRVTFLSALALELVATLSVAIVAVEVALRLLRGWLSFGDALFILVLAPEFYQPLRQLGMRFHAGMEGVSAAARIFSILEAQPDTVSGGGTVPEPPFTIEFRNVHLSYPGNRQPALRGVSFTLPSASKIALVGPSGAGKSTIVRLLLGFLAPSEGEILVNGVSITSLDLEGWRSQIAWVPQQPYLFNDTVAANIRLASPDASDKEVRAAARLAHADTFINALPAGYQTIIGEHGARLSGGQAQRIALARAYLQDAPLLLLDEPTSHLDPRTEDDLRDATYRLLRNRTALMIAHRPVTIAGADEVLTLDEGRIVTTRSGRRQPEDCIDYAKMSGIDGDRTPRQGTTQPAFPLPLEQLPTTPIALHHLLRLVLPSWRRLVLAILLGVFAIGSNVSLLAVSAYLISAATLQPSIADLGVAIVGVRFFGLSRGVFRYLERLVSHDLTFRLLTRWRVWFYAALEPLAPARIFHYRSGDLLGRILNDVANLEHVYVRGLGPPLIALIVSGGMLIFLSVFDWRLAAALLLFLLLAGVVIPLLSLAGGRRPGQQLINHRAILEALLVDGVQGMGDLLAAGRGAAWNSAVETQAKALAARQRHLNTVVATLDGLGVLAAHLAVWTVLWLAIPLVSSGAIAGVHLATLALASLAAFEAVQPLPLAAQQLSQSLASVKRLLAIIDASPAVAAPSTARPAPTHPHLAVRDLTFHYHKSEAPALDELSFALPPGKWLAVVGPSGAGKSTLVNLLLRFWEVAPSSIQLDGSDINAFQPDDVRRLFAVIPQQPYLFNASLRDNIRLARPDAAPQDIEAATKIAQLAKFVATLPLGLETMTGERGLQLSGGQGQRVAIARAILQDAPILLLDEPTAQLDPGTEAALLATVFDYARGRSLLLVTHRLVGMEQMDEIIVLDAGRVVERGSHDQLLHAQRLYAELWRLQEQLPRTQIG